MILKHHIRSFLILSLCASFIAAATTALIIWVFSNHLISPLSTSTLTNSSPSASVPVVYGFLPYWNRDKFTYFPPQLTDLAFFAVSLNNDGTITTKESTYTEPGYRFFQLDRFHSFHRQARTQHINTILTVTSFSNDNIETIFSNPQSRLRAANSIIDFASSLDFQGINLDFEYQGEPDSQLQQDFVNFVTTLSGLNQQLPNPMILDLSVYADSAAGNRLWLIPKLLPTIDRIIIMAYDFHRPASPTAGPVAPLYGAGKFWSHDITSLLAQHLSQTDPSQLILGIPLYGYQWQTLSTKAFSTTATGSGSLASLTRTNTLITTHKPQIFWDFLSMSPWLVWQDTQGTHQIYFENTQSLRLKLQLATDLQLAGVAFWALGYEPQSSLFWDSLFTSSL